MHFCQLPQETHIQICQCLQAMGQYRSLVHYACICRALEGTTLNVLWSVLPKGLSPLFAHLPSSIRQMFEAQTDDTLDTLVVDINTKEISADSEWARFLYYASCVKTLCIRTDPFEDIPDQDEYSDFSAFRAESRWLTLYKNAFPGELLLPNLRVLSVDGWAWGPKDHELLDSIVGPHFRRLSFSFLFCQLSDIFLQDLMPKFAKKPWKALTSLDLVVPFETLSPATNVAVNDFIRTVPQLQSLRFAETALTGGSIACISTWPSLRELHVHDLGLINAPLSPDSFPSLQSLNIELLSFQTAQAIIRALPNSPVQKLILRLRDPLTAAEFSSLSTLIQSSCSRHDLQFLKIWDHSYHTHWTESSQPTPLLDPLFVFTNLSVISISVNVTLLLDDNVLADLSSSWPKLQLLKIQNPCQTPPMVTLPGLIPLTNNCRCLKYISIGSLNTSDTQSVVMFLHQIFPSLRGITTLNGNAQWEDDFLEDWMPSADI